MATLRRIGPVTPAACTRSFVTTCTRSDNLMALTFVYTPEGQRTHASRMEYGEQVMVLGDCPFFCTPALEHHYWSALDSFDYYGDLDDDLALIHRLESRTASPTPGSVVPQPANKVPNRMGPIRRPGPG